MSKKQTLTLTLIFLLMVMPIMAVVNAQEGYWYRIGVYTGDTSGSITITYGGVTHGPGVYAIGDGTPAVISAVADEGYVFDYYSFTYGSNSGTTTVNPISTTILSAFNVVAHFKVNVTATYNVFLTARNYGTESSNYASITFNGVTQSVAETEETLWFRMGSGVTYSLNAVPAVGYEFLGWTVNGVNVSSTNPYYTNTEARDIYANFDEIEVPDSTINDLFVNIYTDSLIVRGNSVGVSINNGSTSYINEGSSTWMRLEENDTVHLEAYPDVACTFTAFEYNGANITSNTLDIVMNDTFIDVKAYFSYDVETPHFILSVQNVNNALVNTDNLVVVEYDNGKIAEVTDIVGFWARIYNTSGVPVKLTALPDTGYEFSYYVFNGSISLTNPAEFVMTGTVNIVAYFNTVNETGMPTATPTPTTSTVPSIFDDLDIESFFTNITLLLQLVVAAILTFVGVLLLMRQAKAWIAGLILLLAGFALTLFTQPNYWALVIWGAECTVYAAILYSMKNRG